VKLAVARESNVTTSRREPGGLRLVAGIGGVRPFLVRQPRTVRRKIRLMPLQMPTVFFVLGQIDGLALQLRVFGGKLRRAFRKPPLFGGH
jgi:hypothetical protein